MNQGVRLGLALFLSIGLSFVYLTFVAPVISPQPAKNLNVAKPVAVTETVEKTTPNSITAPTDTIQKPAVSIDAKETQAKEESLLIETPVAKITLNNKGGVLTAYELLDYKKDVSPNSEPTDLLKDYKGSQALFLGLKGYSTLSDDKVFEITKQEKQSDGSHLVELTWQNSELQIKKTFVFNLPQSPYGIHVDYQVTNLSDRNLDIAPYLQSTLRQKPQPKSEGGFLSFLKFEQPDQFSRMYYKDDSLNTAVNWDDFKGGEAVSGDVSWVGLSDRYFIVAQIPNKPANVASITTSQFNRKGEFVVGQLYANEQGLKPGAQMAGGFQAYLGPKKLEDLKAMGANLDKSVDYGWFSILAVPILWLMTFLHQFISNWGLVIIVMTFIIKVMLHPVNKKSMESMKSMQQLQPKMAELKKKYADDKEKLNQEVMKLFRTHKVNPMGGCLPMLLQMPIYIVLYKVLWNSIELYHAPFFGIYQDLSAPDPYFILPALLGVFMFLQQKLTPSASADASQQKMMMFMPIMFTGFMLFLPVGLVVYIFVNTVISVVQQFMIKREISFKDLITGKWEPNGAH